MTEAKTGKAPSPVTALSWCRANRHFLAAAVLLGASAAGWSLAVRVLKIATHKEAVPWPAGVEVNDEFRMISMPDRFGPYEFVSADGELFRDQKGRPRKDGKPDGDGVIDKETMELLKIGTPTDEGNLPKRRSNWFMVRFYRDPRVEAGKGPRYWRAEAYYYTGGVDLVPHVPEICAVAGGAIHLGSEVMPIQVPSLRPPWNGQVGFQRAVFEQSDLDGRASRFIQYYIFSLNGRPENSRHVVRLKLTSPFVRHAYFAKIQFSPLGAVRDQQQVDAAAKEFASHFLPAILERIPMPDDIGKLSAAR